ncbi:hypothetical protein [Streptomyces sp. NPDC003480]
MEAEAICFAHKGDKRDQGTGPAPLVPYRGQWGNRSSGQQALNVPNGKIRALGEQATATHWRLLRKLRCSIIRII